MPHTLRVKQTLGCTLREVAWCDGSAQVICQVAQSQPGTEIIERLCLRCDQPFLAAGRFNRLCETCRRSDTASIRSGRLTRSTCHKELSR